MPSKAARGHGEPRIRLADLRWCLNSRSFDRVAEEPLWTAHQRSSCQCEFETLSDLHAEFQLISFCESLPAWSLPRHFLDLYLMLPLSPLVDGDFCGASAAGSQGLHPRARGVLTVWDCAAGSAVVRSLGRQLRLSSCTTPRNLALLERPRGAPEPPLVPPRLPASRPATDLAADARSRHSGITAAIGVRAARELGEPSRLPYSSCPCRGPNAGLVGLAAVSQHEDPRRRAALGLAAPRQPKARMTALSRAPIHPRRLPQTPIPRWPALQRQRRWTEVAGSAVWNTLLAGRRRTSRQGAPMWCWWPAEARHRSRAAGSCAVCEAGASGAGLRAGRTRPSSASAVRAGRTCQCPVRDAENAARGDSPGSARRISPLEEGGGPEVAAVAWSREP
jgi:hypothetical protein